MGFHSNTESEKDIENNFLPFTNYAHQEYINKKTKIEITFKTLVVAAIGVFCMYLSYNIYSPKAIETTQIVEAVELTPPLKSSEKMVLASEIKIVDFFMENEAVITTMNKEQIEQLMWEKDLGKIDFVHTIEDQTVIGITYASKIINESAKKVKITIDNKVDESSGLKNYKLEFHSVIPQKLMHKHLRNVLSDNSVESQNIVMPDGKNVLTYTFNVGDASNDLKSP